MSINTYLKERIHEMTEQYILTRDPSYLVRKEECIKTLDKINQLEFELKEYQKHYQALYRGKRKQEKAK